MFTFPTPGPVGTSCQAHFYTWAQLSELCSTLLTGFFDRPTPVQAVGEINRDSWSLKFLESPISHEDLDDCDRDANGCLVWELSQALSQKLVSSTLAFPVEASHASDDGVWFTGSMAMYAVTVIRQRCEGLNRELYNSQFQIAQNRLSEPNEAACEAYLRKAICDFLQTEDGRRAYERTCRDFNWGDVETEIPDDFFSAYSIIHDSGRPDSGNFLCCGVVGILVNQDELLGEDVYADEDAEL